MNAHRLGSLALLAGGVALVFAGVSSAFAYSFPGMLASSAAILALLYAGGVWLGGFAAADRSVVLFTRALTVATGPSSGRAVVELFPAPTRAIIEEQCRKALDGQPSRFSCGAGAQRFVVSPLRSAEGVVIYGVLLSGAAAEAEASRFTTVV